MSRIVTDCKQSLAYLDRYKLEPVSVQALDSEGRQSQISVKGNMVKEVFPPEFNKVVYLKDSEGISNKAYHELPMIVPSLPRSDKFLKTSRNATKCFNSCHIISKLWGSAVLKERFINLCFKFSRNETRQHQHFTNTTGDGPQFGSRETFQFGVHNIR